MDLFKKFLDHLKDSNGFYKQHRFLLAVSGGLDSVVLCHLFQQAKLDFLIAHCNFQLRGEESNRDEKFVRQLAEQYHREIVVEKFDTASYAEINKLSTQVAARELRYNWFRSLLAEGHASYIVTAHHADDNIETVVMNFFRGTGLKGLIGMDEHHEHVWRPLLKFRRSEMEVYAQQNSLLHVQDSSNASSNYTRNYFRNELLPAVAKVFPQVEENILKNVNRLAEVEQVYTRAIEARKAQLVEAKGNEEHIPILKLLKTTPVRTLVWELIKGKGFTAHQVDEVLKLVDGDNGSYIQSSTHRIIKNRKWLIIAPLQQDGPSDLVVIDKKDKHIVYAGGKVLIETLPAAHVSITSDSRVALIDSNELQFPLILRKWKKGDYFYPLGMQKKKKLSKFFGDQKLSPIQKEQVWVVEHNKRIAWIVGMRLDDRFKLKASTETVCRITAE